MLAAEIAGFSEIHFIDKGALLKQASESRRPLLSRLRLLLDWSHRCPHPLFDATHYLQGNPAARNSRWPPFLHFLLWGGFEGHQPHPLFDPEWYLDQYPDVATCGLNPLQHYIRFGWREGRNPHPLFDVAWYLRAYPDVKAAGCDPLIHFLRRGAGEGRQPHPLFNTRWYLRRYQRARESGLNPLVHYVLHGGVEKLNPNPGFDAVHYAGRHHSSVTNGSNPLTHYLTSAERAYYDPHPGYPRPTRKSQARTGDGRALTLAADSGGKSPPVWRNSFSGASLPVFVVYGPSNISFMQSELVPALAAQSCRTRIHLHTVNYQNARTLLPQSVLDFSSKALIAVTDWSAEREDRHIGFGEAVNYLFARVWPESCFLLVNPDSLPMAGCIDRLLGTFLERSAALVEARQWPSEHPKEYDSATGWTPWASGAFLLIASRAFQQLKGFDPLYFLYNEDVDLSWRAWLQDMPVIYEPRATCAHFTGLLFYRPTRFYYEDFFSMRNFLMISYKFFGAAGESSARRWIEEARLPETFRARIEESYARLRPDIQRVDAGRSFHADKVKIVGLNQYHRLRRT